MKIPSVLALLAVLATTSAAVAGDVAPGLWEISLEASVDAAPGFAPGPLSVNQCFTKQDVRDPGKLLSSVTTAGASDCSYTERGYVGDHFRFKMQCGGTLHLQSSGDVSVAPGRIDGVMTTTSTIDGMQVEFHSTIHGRRLGDC
jgi:hypothetical protein